VESGLSEERAGTAETVRAELVAENNRLIKRVGVTEWEREACLKCKFSFANTQKSNNFTNTLSDIIPLLSDDWLDESEKHTKKTLKTIILEKVQAKYDILIICDFDLSIYLIFIYLSFVYFYFVTMWKELIKCLVDV
jgi:hypothetical protein